MSKPPTPLTAPPPGFTRLTLIDPFEVHICEAFEAGEGAERRFAIPVDARHLNAGGTVHGGALVSFADMTLGQTAWDAVERANIVTVNMQSQFLNPAKAGDLLEIQPEIVRRTRGFVFVRGDFHVRGKVIVAVQSVWKLVGRE